MDDPKSHDWVYTSSKNLKSVCQQTVCICFTFVILFTVAKVWNPLSVDR